MTASILLVEDDTFTGRMMELQFRKNGFEVSLAASGEEALAQFESGTFDLVLTDVMMPGISGIEVLEKIRETHSKEQLPVVLLTALGDGAGIKDGLNKGASDYMGKTSEFDIVLAKVRHHLEVAQLRKAAGAEKVRTGDAPWNWNFARDEVIYSARFHHLIGMAPKTLGNHPDAWFSRIHAEDRTTFQGELDAHRARRKAHFEANFRMQHADTSYVWAHAFGVAAFGKDGRAVRMVGALSLLEDAGGKLAEARRCVQNLKQASTSFGLSDEARHRLEDHLKACLAALT